MVGTFFAEPTLMLAELPQWQKAAQQGHEIGNGCLLAFADPDVGLDNWSLTAVEEEIVEVKKLIGECFPHQKDHPFAFPIGELAGGEDYSPIVQKHYTITRTFYPALAERARGCFLCRETDGLSGQELIRLVELASPMEPVVLAFHGIGAGEASVDASAHEELLKFLQEYEVVTLSSLKH